MKKVRMILSAFVVLTVVGSALAFTKSNPNILLCDTQTFTCIAQTSPSFPAAAKGYSTEDNGVIVTTPVITPFVNNGNLNCNPSDPQARCVQYTGTVYNNN